MTTKTLARIIVAILIAAMLGGASLIIARNNTGSGAETPSGFFH
jgi:hypothetical protein